MLLQAALNGGRTAAEHPALPVTSEQLAAEAQRAVAAGAGAIHLHVGDAQGGESLAPDDVAGTLIAVRAACPGVPLGISTGAWIVPDVSERLASIEQWSVLPDFASVNLHEAGAREVVQLLIERGVGVEAGVWNADAAETFVASGLAERCLRVLLEPHQDDLTAARANFVAIEAVLDRAGVRLPRLLHGAGAAAWGILDEAIRRGYDTRVGLEDILVLPNGTQTPDNAALVAAAAQMISTMRAA
jgi:uncharacterized protein (DUF849 family)